jgi:DNA-directed RNA polymerase specialized sigma24 family protein
VDPAAGGSAIDITAIFRQHYAELVRLAVMLVGDRPTAEDVVQEVFANLHARRDRPATPPVTGAACGGSRWSAAWTG